QYNRKSPPFSRRNRRRRRPKTTTHVDGSRLVKEDHGRGSRNHSVEASPQQDRRILHTFDEAHPGAPVRWISLKLQQEERDRRMDSVPDENAIRVDRIEIRDR
ncbi:hypothetical protein MIMGU_mgv1a022214mg, partial [Erythranthe guttata]